MLHLSSSVGIARELTERLYDKPSRKIREVVTNALDAGATQLIIDFDPRAGGKLVFTDNGSGMSSVDFEKYFLRIGGSPKRTDASKVGRIGVGFLAATFATTLRVYSRAEGHQAFCAELQIDKLFNDENWDTEIQNLDLGDYAPFDPKDLPPYQTFTRLELIGLHHHVLAYFRDERRLKGLQEDLRRVLPLNVPAKSSLLTFLETNTGYDRLLDALRSASLKTINVQFLGTPLTRRLYGENAEESIVAVRELPRQDVAGSVVWGYAIDSGKSVPKEWEGLSSRVKNVAVETSGWLGYEQGGRTHKARVTGELFIEGLEDNSGALNIDRSQLQRSHPQVVAISQYLRDNLTGFLTEVGKRKQQGRLVNLSKLGDISRLPSQPQRALASLKDYVEERLVPAAISATSLTDIRTVSEETLRLLGYSGDEVKELDQGLLGAVNPDGETAFVLKGGLSHHRNDRNEVFDAMDRHGATVGVLATRKHWEVWWGNGADKQQIAKFNLDSLKEESLAGLWFISKKVRWMEGRLRKFQDPTMVLSSFQLLGAVLYCPRLTGPELISLLRREGLDPEMQSGSIVWHELLDVPTSTHEWFGIDGGGIRVRVQVQFDPETGRAIILTSERSVLQSILHWLRAEHEVEVCPLNDLLLSRKGVEVISYARNAGNQVITYSLRSPVLITEIETRDVLGWTLGVDKLYVTIFQNNWVAVPLYTPEDMAQLSRTLFTLGGSQNSGQETSH